MSASFLTSDLSAIFAVADFSVAATYTKADTSTSTVNGIFDDEDLEVDAGDGSVVLQRSAKFTCASADVSGVVEDEGMTIGGKEYTISYVKNDGTGTIELFLQYVP